LIELLHSRNIPVYLVSGGFRAIINPVADHLKIDRNNVYANTLFFNNDGIDYFNSHLRKKFFLIDIIYEVNTQDLMKMN